MLVHASPDLPAYQPAGSSKSACWYTGSPLGKRTHLVVHVLEGISYFCGVKFSLCVRESKPFADSVEELPTGRILHYKRNPNLVLRRESDEDTTAQFCVDRLRLQNYRLM